MKDKPFVRPVLIFRRGSIGDAVVSVPALNEIARRHPDAERWILTNHPVMETAAAVEEVLHNSTLVHGFISLPPGGGGWSDIRAAIRRIRTLGPEVLVYLSEPSGFVGSLKERLFFRMAGIRRIVGDPYRRETGTYRQLGEHRWESEPRRLLRAIGAETVEPDWTFRFTEGERAAARAKLDQWPGRARYIFFSIGAKLPDKDWGDANWSAVLTRISEKHPALGIVAVGAPDESERTRRVLAAWQGPILDLCGASPPRDSALIAESAAFYLGHDSGNMHLAALVGTPCIAVFSARHKPGAWFPRGERNCIFYPWAAESSAPARAGFRTGGTSIQSIRPDEVVEACLALLAGPTA